MKWLLQRQLRVLLIVAFGFTALMVARSDAQVPTRGSVQQRLKSEASAVRIAGVHLQPDDFEPTSPPVAPEEIVRAGDEFVAAWDEYHRALLLKGKWNPGSAYTRKKNLKTESDAYVQLIEKLVESNEPPQPEEFTQFYYDDFGWCGNEAADFSKEHSDLVLLACLRNKRYIDAARMLITQPGLDQLKDDLLTALGFDPAKVVTGAWLSGQYGNLEYLCKAGSDLTARMALRWAELHWDEAVARSKKYTYPGSYRRSGEPELPSLQLAGLLRDGTEVREETKQQISEFLAKNATRLFDRGVWVRNHDAGAAKWLVNIAREALQDERNQVRLAGERILREAGENDVRAELRPAPRYRLYVDGQLWWVDSSRQGFNLRVSVESKTGTFAASPEQPRGEEFMSVDPDHFLQSRMVRAARFYNYPSSFSNGANLAEPWIRVPIPLPPAFGEVTDIRVETVRLTINPKLPRPISEDDDKPIEVDFGVSDNQKPPSSWCVYPMQRKAHLVIERVQPGEYWLRVRAWGAAIPAWKKIGVTAKANVIEPKLDKGTTVALPLLWSENMEPEKLDPFLGRLVRSFAWNHASFLFVLEKNGKKYEQSELSANTDHVTLPGLPEGRYTLKVLSSDEVLALMNAGSDSEIHRPGWKGGKVTFAITSKSPAELHLPIFVFESTDLSSK